MERNVLKIYCVGGELLEGIKAFYGEGSVCVRVKGEFCESFFCWSEKGIHNVTMVV